jgi:hypothetical protein
MIALFHTEAEAVACSNTFHNWLKLHRKGYKAPDGWSKTNKSDSVEKWAVPIPPDYTPAVNAEKVERLPDNWNINTEET